MSPVFAVLLAAMVVAIAPAGRAHAQPKDAYPAQIIKLYVPFSAGGTTDVAARALAERASKTLKQPIEILNRPGGGGTIATAAVAAARPDGYTLAVVTPTALSTAPHMREVPYHPVDDLTPIMQFASFSFALAVRSESPYQTLADFITAARQSPGAVTFGTSGAGSIAQLMVEQVAALEKVKVTHVPFAGGGPALAAVLGGHVTAVAAAEFYPQVQAGKLRALAILGDKRLEDLPNVPTLADLGYALKFGVYAGIVGPKGLPADVVRKLESAFVEATREAEFQKITRNFLMPVTVRESAAFRALVADTYRDYGTVLNQLGMGKK
jgi:tripartite-type tricarboxylate transporter receptor subunit TctC